MNDLYPKTCLFCNVTNFPDGQLFICRKCNTIYDPIFNDYYFYYQDMCFIFKRCPKCFYVLAENGRIFLSDEYPNINPNEENRLKTFLLLI